MHTQQEVRISSATKSPGKRAARDGATVPPPGPPTTAGAAATQANAPHANSSSGSSGYSIARPMGTCAVTGRAIVAGEKFHAALRETPIGLERLDVTPEAWDAFDKQGLLASWLATMPPPNQEKKKLFVDDETLLTLFERLSETTEANKLRFRFVLGLVLMRKRLVMYESQFESGATSYWKVKLKGRTELMDILNPHLTEDQVGDVAAQLGEILSSEL